MQNNTGTLVCKKKSIYALCAVLLMVICTIGYYLYPRPPITHAFGYRFGAKIDKYQKKTQREQDIGSHELYIIQSSKDVLHVAPLLTDGIDGFNNHCLIHASDKSHSIYEINIFNQNDMSANENELNRLYEKTCEMVDAKYPSWKSYVDYLDGQKVHFYVSKNGFRIKVSYQEQSVFYGRIITPGYVCLSFLNVNLWCKADKESKQIRQQTMDSVKQLDKALGN